MLFTMTPHSSPSSSQPIVPGVYRWNQPSLPSRIPRIVWWTSHFSSDAMFLSTLFILLLTKVQFINLIFRVLKNVLDKIKRSSNNTYDVKSSFASALKLNKKKTVIRLEQQKLKEKIILLKLYSAGYSYKLRQCIQKKFNIRLHYTSTDIKCHD